MSATYTVGDGKTYSTIAAALAAVPTNLSGQGVQRIEVYAKAAGYAETIDGIGPFTNPSASDYIEFVAMVPHTGKKDTGIVLDVGSGSVANHIILVAYTRFHGFCVKCTSTYAGQTNRIFYLTQSNIKIYDNIIYGIDVSGQSCTAINTSGINEIYNNVVFDIGLSSSVGNGIVIASNGSAGNPHEINNNTVYNAKTYCFNGSSKVYMNVKNNYAGHDGSGTDYNGFGGGTGVVLDYNIDSDNTDTGTNSLHNKSGANQFVDKANGDFHLKATADCNRSGLDLSSKFTTDYEGQTRVNWNTGADEYGTPEQALSGTVPGSSGLSGTLSLEVLLSGTIGGSSGLSGAPEIDQYLAGTIPGASDLAGAPEIDQYLAGTIPGASDLSGAITREAWLSGEIPGRSGLTGALTGPRISCIGHVCQPAIGPGPNMDYFEISGMICGMNQGGDSEESEDESREGNS